MSEVIWVAAISSASGLIGVAIGALANVWGPAAAERRRLADERENANAAERQAAASAFVESLAKLAWTDNPQYILDIESVRLRFVATLRQGEGAADAFTLGLSERVKKRRGTQGVGAIIQCGSGMVFGWMRGDLRADQLTIARLDRELNPQVDRVS